MIKFGASKVKVSALMLHIEYVWDPLNIYVLCNSFYTREKCSAKATILFGTQDVWVNKAFVDRTWLVILAILVYLIKN